MLRPKRSRTARIAATPSPRIEVVVGDDDVRRPEHVEGRHRLLKAMGGRDTTAPAAQEYAQAFKHARLVVDGENFQALERLAGSDRLGRVGLRAGLEAPRVRAAQ